MDENFQRLTALAACLLLAGCGTMRSSVVVQPAAGSSYSSAVASPRAGTPGGSYQVIKGDTLYSIAFRNGVDFRSLAQWNGIAAPFTIWPGQRLALHRPGASADHQTAASTGSPEDSGHAVAPSASAPVFTPVRVSSASSSSTGASASVTPMAPATAQIHPSAFTHSDSVAAPMHASTSAVAAVVPVAGKPTVPVVIAPAPPTPAIAGRARAVSGISWRWPADGGVTKGFSSGDAIPGIEISGKPGEPVRAAADGVVVYSGNGLVGYGELVIIKHSDSFLSAYGHNRERLVKEGQRVTAGQIIAKMGSTGASRNELEFQVRKNGDPVDPMDYLPPRR